jgi:hypothetical protein
MKRDKISYIWGVSKTLTKKSITPGVRGHANPCMDVSGTYLKYLT